MSTTVAVIAVIVAVLILSILIFACWKGEKVGRRAHLPFRDARQRRKMRNIQAEEEGRYSESWASTQLEPYAVEAPGTGLAELGNDEQRPSTPPPAYFPRSGNNGPPQTRS